MAIENNIPSYSYNKKLSAGKFQLSKAGTLTDNGTIPAIAGSFTLGVISADKTVTFTDGDSEDDGVTMTVHNKNTSSFAWNVSGNVKESSTLDDITTLETGLHLFQWDETGGYWVRLTAGGSGGGGLTEGTMYS